MEGGGSDGRERREGGKYREGREREGVSEGRNGAEGVKGGYQ